MKGRQKDIFDILYKCDRISVTELAKSLFVSEMTIRRDLNDMDKKGIVKRFRGGAVLTAEYGDMPISRRFFSEESEKKRLSKKASQYLKDDITVYIGSSSTCQYIIPYLSGFKNITLVTNSVNSLLIAAKFNIHTILIGGEYYEKDMCFTGSLADEFASRFNADIAFLSALGISDDGVISDHDLGQTEVRRRIMKNSKKNIFLFEKGKTGKIYTYTLCGKEDAYEVIV